jgi:hypothetical protein
VGGGGGGGAGGGRGGGGGGGRGAVRGTVPSRCVRGGGIVIGYRRLIATAASERIGATTVWHQRPKAPRAASGVGPRTASRQPPPAASRQPPGSRPPAPDCIGCGFRCATRGARRGLIMQNLLAANPARPAGELLAGHLGARRAQQAQLRGPSPVLDVLYYILHCISERRGYYRGTPAVSSSYQCVASRPLGGVLKNISRMKQFGGWLVGTDGASCALSGVQQRCD